MGEIKVEYDGEYPCTCMGRLKIWEGGKLIYDNEFCCISTGSVTFDDDWNEHIAKGQLLWEKDEANKFESRIISAVNNKLSEFTVCCGGCV